MNLRNLFVSTLCIGLAACATGGGRGYGYGGPPANGQNQNVRCYDCGVIERIETVYGNSSASGGGAVLGGIVGGVLGNQVGKGDGRKAATVVGAVGGAVAGHQIEKNVKSAPTYDVFLRMDDGRRIVINQRNLANVAPGDYVRVTNNQIVPLR
ncbi:MAG: peptidoglycan-associated outer membrane lipoprotein precursor [Gammaproteobacteria bacterium HGW-Gammaproteobacteria-5]|nr:MAG: peptidoglycan-associated outer membrane lipoprotein precursor [Gammaproteobacteria bacterium HGW-Gammaproteobacteria-5]